MSILMQYEQNSIEHHLHFSPMEVFFLQLKHFIIYKINKSLNYSWYIAFFKEFVT